MDQPSCPGLSDVSFHCELSMCYVGACMLHCELSMCYVGACMLHCELSVC